MAKKTKDVDLRDMCPPYDPSRTSFGQRAMATLLRDGEVTMRVKDGKPVIVNEDGEDK